MYHKNPLSDGFHQVFTADNVTGSERGMDYGLGTWGNKWTYGHVESSGKSITVGKNIANPVDKWHLMTVTRNFNTENTTYYVDGKLGDYNGSLSGKIKKTRYYKIGAKYNGGFPWKGKMDEFRIYNRSLSQQEIQRLYNVRSENWAVSGCKLTG